MLDLDKFRMGYFLVWKHKNDWVGKQVEKEQLKAGFDPSIACYTHVDVCGGGPYAVRTNPPKTKIIDIREQYKGREFILVRYRNAEYETKKRYKVAFWSASHCNLTYDYFGVVRFKIKWLFHMLNWWFCSENGLFSLQKEFPQALDGMKPEDCMPAHFLVKSDFEIVMTGKI